MKHFIRKYNNLFYIICYVRLQGTLHCYMCINITICLMLYYFSFPKDEIRKKMWLKACKIKLCLPSNKICGDHFLPKHYSLSGYLSKDAVPFLASTSTGI